MKIRHMLVALACLFPQLCLAQGNIDTLSVDQGIATFTLFEGVSNTAAASCAALEHQNTWTIALNSLQGRAAYVMLMSSVATNVPIKITSANDCSDIAGISRAASISMQSTE